MPKQINNNKQSVGQLITPILIILKASCSTLSFISKVEYIKIAIYIKLNREMIVLKEYSLSILNAMKARVINKTKGAPGIRLRIKKALPNPKAIFYSLI